MARVFRNVLCFDGIPSNQTRDMGRMYRKGNTLHDDDGVPLVVTRGSWVRYENGCHICHIYVVVD